MEHIQQCPLTPTCDLAFVRLGDLNLHLSEMHGIGAITVGTHRPREMDVEQNFTENTASPWLVGIYNEETQDVVCHIEETEEETATAMDEKNYTALSLPVYYCWAITK